MSPFHKDGVQEPQECSLPQILSSVPSHLAGSYLYPSIANQMSSSFLDLEIPSSELLNVRQPWEHRDALLMGSTGGQRSPGLTADV